MAGSGSKKTQFPTRRANANAKVRQQVQQMLNARRELKYITGTSSGTTAVTGFVFPITQEIVLGDSSNTRDGDTCQVKEISLSFRASISGANTYDTLRFILFVDRFNDGVLPATSDILVTSNPESIFTREVLIRKRYRILHDISRTLSDDGSNNATVIRAKSSLKAHQCYFNGSTNNATSNGPGAIFLLVISRQSTNPAAYYLERGTLYYDS